MKAIEIDSFKMIGVPLGPSNWKISEIRDPSFLIPTGPNKFCNPFWYQSLYWLGFGYKIEFTLSSLSRKGFLTGY